MNLFAWFLRRMQREQELDDEVRGHLAMAIRERIERGEDPAEAEMNARREFGNATLVKEVTRDMWGWRWLDELAQDVRFGLRQFRRSPGFTAVAVLTLALGIGANTAIFSVVNGVLLSSLPFPDPGRLVVVWEMLLRTKHIDAISYPNFRDWRREAHSFENMSALGHSDYELTSPGTPEHVWGYEVTSGFFATLGVRLKLGREFSRPEDVPGGAPVAIISDRIWRNRFGASPRVLGKIVTLNGVDRTIVGVAPPGFHLFGDQDIYTPLAQRTPAFLNPRGIHYDMAALARLKPGVPIAAAQAEMSAIQQHLDQVYPAADRGLGTEVQPLKEEMIGDTGKILLLVWGAVGLVLLIACANVANLLLARAATRRREFALRSALGATRVRVLRQLLTESVLLSLAGGGLGLLIAAWGVKPVLAVVPGALPRSQNIHLSLAVLLFALGIAVLVGVIFGLSPTRALSGRSLQGTIQSGGRMSQRGTSRAQAGLVIFQIALTLVLLAGAGLLLRTIRRMWNTNPGFDTQHVLSLKLGLSPSASKTGASTKAAYRQLLQRIQLIPGVEAADFTYIVPLSQMNNVSPFWIDSRKPAEPQAASQMMVFDTGPDYLRVMKIPLLRGRFFTTQDTEHSPCVAVVDAVFARLYFPGQDPLAHSITVGWSPPHGPCRIVGVVGHVRHWGLGSPGKEVRAQSYYPLYQIPDRDWAAGELSSMSILVRSRLARGTLIPEIKNAVYGAGRRQSIYDVETMAQVAAESMSSQRFPMVLLGIFAGLALLLASVGIYGVMAYSVSQRVHEIGIRMALGARKRDVLRRVIGQGFKLIVAGLAIGVATTLVLARLLGSLSRLPFGFGSLDPAIVAGVSLLLLGVATLACYVPARRAADVDPMVALRHE